MILSFGSDPSAGAAAPLLLALPSVLALAAYLGAGLVTERLERVWQILLMTGWVAHGIAIVIDIAGIGAETAGARFGFAPALSATVWLVLTVYGIESRFVALHGARRALALLGAAAVMLALSYPGELRPQAMSRWAPLHWLLGLASYGLFGAAVLHGVLLNRAERQLKMRAAPAASGMPLLRLERLTFRFVGAGFAVLSAALLLGAWFANPWRWDHKSVFSILGWIVFAALLAGRRAFGWRGPHATRWLYAGAALLLLAYVGSRFVLEVLLHRPAPV
jgi:ABC-type uncharacterized transport system permease subunit